MPSTGPGHQPVEVRSTESPIEHLISLPPRMAGRFQALESPEPSRWYADADPEGRPLGSGGGMMHLLERAWRAAAGRDWVGSMVGVEGARADWAACVATNVDRCLFTESVAGIAAKRRADAGGRTGRSAR